MNNPDRTDEHLGFKPFSNSWVAIHPNPKGVIQLVGSFFIFGSLPTLFYNSLLRRLYDRGYTIIAYPCSIIPPLIWKSKLVNHWQASLQLLIEQYRVKSELIDYLSSRYPLNSIDIYLDRANYFWIGHSLGCKYISLLEILSNNPSDLEKILLDCNVTNKETIDLGIKFLEKQREEIADKVINLFASRGITKQLDLQDFILDQPSILLAPEISGTQQKKGEEKPAIPLFKLFPTGETTICLIKKSGNLFNLTALIAFENDGISQDDVAKFSRVLLDRSKNFIFQIFPGCNSMIEFVRSLLSHLKPIDNDNKALADCVDKIFDELRKRPNPKYAPQEVECYKC